MDQLGRRDQPAGQPPQPDFTGSTSRTTMAMATDSGGRTSTVPTANPTATTTTSGSESVMGAPAA